MIHGGNMTDEYGSDDNNAFGIIVIFITVFIISYSSYQFGYSEAKIEYSQITKYRCHEGTVYRSTQGYWENTKQACKSLEEIK